MIYDVMKCGGENKFIVIKRDDLELLTNHEIGMLFNYLKKIKEGRRTLGQPASPEHIVVSTDEPFIDEIIEVLKKNDCWGLSAYTKFADIRNDLTSLLEDSKVFPDSEFSFYTLEILKQALKIMTKKVNKTQATFPPKNVKNPQKYSETRAKVMNDEEDDDDELD